LPSGPESARWPAPKSAARWAVQNFKGADLHAARGIALREFELNPGHGTADYLLYVDGRAAGVIEAKRQSATLTGVEVQSGRYAQGLPASLPACRRPLPFLCESTGLETHFTNRLDPEPRARARGGRRAACAAIAAGGGRRTSAARPRGVCPQEQPDRPLPDS
jgi:type I site-specific restriction endonuclease